MRRKKFLFFLKHFRRPPIPMVEKQDRMDLQKVQTITSPPAFFTHHLPLNALDDIVRCLEPPQYVALLRLLHHHQPKLFFKFLQHVLIEKPWGSNNFLELILVHVPAAWLLDVAKKLINSKHHGVLFSQKIQTITLLLCCLIQVSPNTFYTLLEKMPPLLVWGIFLQKKSSENLPGVTLQFFVETLRTLDLDIFQKVLHNLVCVITRNSFWDTFTTEEQVRCMQVAWETIDYLLAYQNPIFTTSNMLKLRSLILLNQLALGPLCPSTLEQERKLFFLHRDGSPEKLVPILIAIANTQKNPHQFLQDCIDPPPHKTNYQNIHAILCQNVALKGSIIRSREIKNNSLALRQLAKVVCRHKNYYYALFNLPILTASATYTPPVVNEICSFLPLETDPCSYPSVITPKHTFASIKKRC